MNEDSYRGDDLISRPPVWGKEWRWTMDDGRGRFKQAKRRDGAAKSNASTSCRSTTTPSLSGSRWAILPHCMPLSRRNPLRNPRLNLSLSLHLKRPLRRHRSRRRRKREDTL